MTNIQNILKTSTWPKKGNSPPEKPS